MSFFTIQLLCTAGIVVGALIIIALERLFPYNDGHPLFRNGFFTDLVMYNFIQTFILSLIISGIIEYIDTATGWSRLQIISDWSIWQQLVFFTITHDLYIYWFHRLQHRSKYLWRIHEAHHSNKKIDWLAGSRSHPLEILINQTIEFAPMVLLGAPAVVMLYKGVIDAIWGMYIHSNINVQSGKLQYIINGPEMHRWHHAEDKRAYDNNFSTKIAIWDWLFSTAFFPKREKANQYGLEDPHYPQGYFRQVLYAFRKFTTR